MGITGEGLLVIGLLLLAGILAGHFFWPKLKIEPAGPTIRSNELQDQRLRNVARVTAEKAEIGGMPREVAQEHIEKACRKSVCEEYARMHPGVPVEETEHWPGVTCIITGNTAVIELWVGHTLDREGIDPVRAEVKRAAVLKLDNRRPIKEAFAEIYTPPEKAKPAQTPTPVRSRKLPAKR